MTTDLRPPSETLVLTLGLPWWLEVTDDAAAFTPATVIAADLLDDWDSRTPAPGPGVEVRRGPDGAAWIGQPAAYTAGVFYLTVSVDGMSPPVPRAAISLILRPAGGSA